MSRQKMKTRHVENEGKQHRTEGAAARNDVQRPFLLGLTVPSIFSLLLPLFLHPAAKDAKNHLTNGYRGGYYIRKAGSAKKVMGACQKKIVRLILMSNISRRKFLKGAGVAALAVAAAGVLAGCSGNDVPSIPDVTAKNVTVKFVDRKGKEVGTTVVKNVKLTETKMNSNDVQAPEGYVVGIVGDQFIDWDNQTVTFTVDKVDKKETDKVTVNYYYRGVAGVDGSETVGTEVLEVEKGATKFNTSELKEIPKGFKLDTLGDIAINKFKNVTVYVSRK